MIHFGCTPSPTSSQDETQDLERARLGDYYALGRVLLGARPIAVAVARKLARRAGRLDQIEDLVGAAIAGSSRGVGGLIAAVRSYDPSLGSWRSHAYSRCYDAVKSELRAHRFGDELTEENEPRSEDPEDYVIALIDSAKFCRSGSRPRRRALQS